ncbi:redoxin domain-containing protein [Mucilaginibacter ximonensis]|uniref:Redoxin domain-containing protein n=1 Tax=Mucilaginibacter ximonensis TaxID=538021 RepID=A0ABW5Y9M1_9SPHI
MQRVLLFSFAFINFCSNIFGQSVPVRDLPGEPIIGKPCPEFHFNQVDFYSKKAVSLSDFKGKWLILDFWSKDCSSCIASFPSINREQQQLKDSVQFLMVTYDDVKHVNRTMYASFKKKLNLQMPCAFDDADSTLFREFNVGLLPHNIVVDPKGIVRVITSKLLGEKLKAFMAGKPVSFPTPSYLNDKNITGEEKFQYNRNLPYLVNGNGGIDGTFSFRSMLTMASAKTPSSEIVDYKKGRLEMLGYPLTYLYAQAYFGKYLRGLNDSLLNDTWLTPVLKLKDTSIFQYDFAGNKNLFCYSLVVPNSHASKESILNRMQADLRSYFGYEATIEKRKMPYWRLIATAKAKSELKTKGGPSKLSDNGKPWQQISMRNQPMSYLVKIVGMYSGVVERDGIPVIDETGIAGNIDMDIDWATDFAAVKEELNRHGLDLVSGEKEMKTLVLRDAINLEP